MLIEFTIVPDRVGDEEVPEDIKEATEVLMSALQGSISNEEDKTYKFGFRPYLGKGESTFDTYSTASFRIIIFMDKNSKLLYCSEMYHMIQLPEVEKVDAHIPHKLITLEELNDKVASLEIGEVTKSQAIRMAMVMFVFEKTGKFLNEFGFTI